MFQKYNTIQNVERQKYVDNAINLCLPCKWVAQEKVHGANFSFIYDGNKLLCAKRTGLIEEDEKFYNYLPVKEKWSLNVIALYNHLGCKTLTVFGELFGRGVQNGIFYSEEQSFYAFDIIVDGEYQDIDRCNELFKQFGFFYAKSLIEGTITECFEYPNEFDSFIPEWLGGERLKDNLCEGTIIRPQTTAFFNSGSRVIFKNKNEKWSEKTRTREPKTEFVMPPEVVPILETATAYINENRLRNVLSKLGEFDPKDFGKVAGLLTKDVIEELQHDVNLKELDKSHSKILTKQINRECCGLLKANIHNIIDGNF